ncbi:MAG: GTPase [Candidatus Micrarchaeota archaeon]
MPDERKRSYARVSRLLKGCDIAIEVVDARDIEGTRLRKLDGQFKSKVFIVATKYDLLPKDAIFPKETWGIQIIPFSARTRKGLVTIFRTIRRMAKSKGLEKAKVAIFGIPNVGKSSLINVMRGRHSAKTGFRPGVTKAQQWITIRSGILLYDTPGVIDFKTTNNELAIKGAVDIDKLKDPESVAISIIERFQKAGNSSLEGYYAIPHTEDGFEILSAIASRRGLLLRGGELNTFEAARVLIREFQKGRFTL